MWAEYKRIIRPKGAIVLTARCPFDKALGMSNLRAFSIHFVNKRQPYPNEPSRCAAHTPTFLLLTEYRARLPATQS